MRRGAALRLCGKCGKRLFSLSSKVKNITERNLRPAKGCLSPPQRLICTEKVEWDPHRLPQRAQLRFINRDGSVETSAYSAALIIITPFLFLQYCRAKTKPASKYTGLLFEKSENEHRGTSPRIATGFRESGASRFTAAGARPPSNPVCTFRKHKYSLNF